MSDLKRKRGSQVLAVSLGDFVRKIRKSQNMQQGELAKKLGITQASLSRIEAGGSEVTFSRMMQICAALMVSVECGFVDHLGFFIRVSGQDNIAERFYFSDWIPF
jgi:transcriptional regulator with XRE-family HTH domain